MTNNGRDGQQIYYIKRKFIDKTHVYENNCLKFDQIYIEQCRHTSEYCIYENKWTISGITDHCLTYNHLQKRHTHTFKKLSV